MMAEVKRRSVQGQQEGASTVGPSHSHCDSEQGCCGRAEHTGGRQETCHPVLHLLFLIIDHDRSPCLTRSPIQNNNCF